MPNTLFSLQQALQQLQNSHSINQQLQQHIHKQNKQLQQAQSILRNKDKKIDQLSLAYQNNIRQLRDAIESRDQQLLSLRQQINVTDYHMIRLKVLNEVQLAHRDEIQTYQKQIQQRQNKLNKLSQDLQIIQQKYNILLEQKKQILDENSIKTQQINTKHSKQLTKIYIALQQQRNKTYKTQLRLTKLKQKYDAIKLKQNNVHNAPIYDSILADYQTIPNNTETQNTHKLQKILQQKDNQLQTSKDRHQKITIQLKNKISDLQKQIRSYSSQYISYIEYQRKINEKNIEIMQLEQNCDRKIQRINRDHQQEIIRFKKDYESKLEANYRNKQDIYNNRQKYGTSGDKVNDNDLESFRELIRSLQRRNQQLERQKQEARKQAQSKNNDKNTNNNQQKNPNVFRTKLQTANKQIVALLKQKISLKQRIQQLQAQIK